MTLTKLMKGSALGALAAAMAFVALPDPAEAQSRDRQERSAIAAIVGMPASSANASAAKHASVCAKGIPANSAALEANAGLFRSTARTVAATTAQI